VGSSQCSDRLVLRTYRPRLHDAGVSHHPSIRVCSCPASDSSKQLPSCSPQKKLPMRSLLPELRRRRALSASQIRFPHPPILHFSFSISLQSSQGIPESAVAALLGDSLVISVSVSRAPYQCHHRRHLRHQTSTSTIETIQAPHLSWSAPSHLPFDFARLLRHFPSQDCDPDLKTRRLSEVRPVAFNHLPNP
jgi:hypothetical protein